MFFVCAPRGRNGRSFFDWIECHVKMMLCSTYCIMSFEVRVQPVRRQYLFQLEKDSEGSWFNHGLETRYW
jgi:hypothetical protein